MEGAPGGSYRSIWFPTTFPDLFGHRYHRHHHHVNLECVDRTDVVQKIKYWQLMPLSCLNWVYTKGKTVNRFARENAHLNSVVPKHYITNDGGINLNIELKRQNAWSYWWITFTTRNVSLRADLDSTTLSHGKTLRQEYDKMNQNWKALLASVGKLPLGIQLFRFQLLYMNICLFVLQFPWWPIFKISLV